MSAVWFIDTNAGPILRRRFSSWRELRAYMQRSIPLLDRRGYSSSWEVRVHRHEGHTLRWHVISVHNSKGRVVHRAAARELRRNER